MESDHLRNGRTIRFKRRVMEKIYWVYIFLSHYTSNFDIRINTDYIAVMRDVFQTRAKTQQGLTSNKFARRPVFKSKLKQNSFLTNCDCPPPFRRTRDSPVHRLASMRLIFSLGSSPNSQGYQKREIRYSLEKFPATEDIFHVIQHESRQLHFKVQFSRQHIYGHIL
jgi:hypothetical protein